MELIGSQSLCIVLCSRGMPTQGVPRSGTHRRRSSDRDSSQSDSRELCSAPCCHGALFVQDRPKCQSTWKVYQPGRARPIRSYFSCMRWIWGVTLRFISIKLGTRASIRLAWGTGAEVPVVADEDGGAAAASPVMAAVVLVATADDSTPSAAPPFAGCRLFF
jgi:hypothetical protein